MPKFSKLTGDFREQVRVLVEQHYRDTVGAVITAFLKKMKCQGTWDTVFLLCTVDVGLSWGGDRGGGQGPGSTGWRHLYRYNVFVSLTITYARSGHFQEKPKDKTLICFVLSFYLFNLFFWGSEAHLVFRFRLEDSVSPS